MKVRQLSPDAIKPYPGNPRVPNQAVAKVRASLEEFGFQQPIVVDKAMVIVVGHTRYAAAIAMGLPKVPVVVADTLSPAQVKAYRIADNRTGAEAEFDFEKLKVELADLTAERADLGTLGFDAQELADLLTLPEEDGDGGGGGREPGLGSPVISYVLIFENEAQQATWFDFLRFLKEKLPQEETHAERLTRFLNEGGYGARS